MQNAAQLQSMNYQRDRANDMLMQAEDMAVTIQAMKTEYLLMKQMAENTHRLTIDTAEIKATSDQLRDRLADFDDFWRPLRSYFYWEKHCFDIPICWSLRSIFDALDGVDQVAERLTVLTGDMTTMDLLMPQMVETFPPMIEAMENMRTLTLSFRSTMVGIYDQMADLSGNAMAMGNAFDAAKNDDSFYLPPEVSTTIVSSES